MRSAEVFENRNAKSKMAIQKLLVLFYCSGRDEKAVKVEMDYLTAMLKTVDCPANFCVANELVNRNRITCNSRLILKEAAYRNLRSFRFILNKN